MERKELLMIIILIAIMLAVFSIITSNPIKIINIIIQGNFFILYSFALIMVSEIIKSFRLYYTCKSLNYKLNFSEAIEIQLSGFFAGTITPGNIGGVPTVAGLINKYAQGPIGEAFGISSFQAFIDGIIPALVSILVSIFYLPMSIGVVIFSLSTIILWASALSINIKRILLKIMERFHKNFVRESILSEIERFQSSLKIISNKKLLIISILISLLSYIVQIYSIKILLINENISLIKIFIGLMFDYTMASFPTPAGEGGVEYGLSIVLPLRTVITWRIAYIFSGLISGIFSTIVLRKILKENR